MDQPVMPAAPFAAPIGVGTVKWGRNTGLKHAPFALPDDSVLHSLLDIAEAGGVTLLDTAPAYGIAEERLGRLLADRPSRFHVFTKAGESFTDGTSHWDFSAAAIRRSVDESLRRLRTDCLDGVSLHCPLDDLGVLEQSDAPDTLRQLRDAGKVRLTGFSVMSREAGLRAVPHFDFVMVAWNPGFHEHQPVIEAAAAAGKGILLKKVLGSGRFDGLPDPAACLRSALALPGRPVALVGTITPQHLRDNLAAGGLAP